MHNIRQPEGQMI